MLKRAFQLLLVASLATATLRAATDPFVGDWKLSPSKSKLVDHMKVESLGGNKYEFDLGGGPEKIVADGTDQAGAFGTMLSVTVEGPDTWKVVRKKDGRMLLTGNWKLSHDGYTLTDNYTEFDAKGAPSTTNYLFTRTAGGPGFAGTWESTMPMTSSFVLQIRPYAAFPQTRPRQRAGWMSALWKSLTRSMARSRGPSGESFPPTSRR